ncbi:MAG: universal stress protein [Chloroflexi bacterium]|nr:universal stress protein [Chloroflexota bacterium]
MKRKLLIPLDGSTFSVQIVDSVIEFLSPDTHELILLRVVHRPRGLTARPPHPSSADTRVLEYDSEREITRLLHPIFDSQAIDSVIGTATDMMGPVRRRLEANGFTVRTAVLTGEPRHEIEEYVETEGIDMVAITTHGRTGLNDLVMGSVAEHILRTSHVPVLMLRPSAALQELLREDERLAHA